MPPVKDALQGPARRPFLTVEALPQNRNRYHFLIPFSVSAEGVKTVCISGVSAYKVMERKISVSVPGLSTSGVCLIRIVFAGISASVRRGRRAGWFPALAAGSAKSAAVLGQVHSLMAISSMVRRAASWAS